MAFQLAQSYLQGMANPLDGVLEAYGQGQGLRQNRDLLQAQQAEQARKMQAQQELEQLDWNDMSAVSRVVAQYPEYTAGAKEYYGQMEAKAKEGLFRTMSRGVSALQSGSNQVASDLFRDQAEGYRNVGDEEAAETADWLAEMSITSPETAQRALMLQLASVGGKDTAAAYGSYSGASIAEDAAPVDRAKTQAEADKLTTLTPLEAKNLEATETDIYAGAKQKIATATNLDAKTTETLTLLPHEQARLDSATSLNTANAGLAATRATDIPIARADAQAQQEVSNQLSQLKLQLQSEGNSVARDRLQVQIDKLEHTKAAYAAGLTTKQIATNLANQKRLAAYDKNIGGLNQTRSTITRLLNNKSGMAGATGAIQGRTPSLRANVIQFEKDLETLQSQVFLTQVEKMRGLGALTDFEGKKLESGIANLSLVQSEEDMKKNLTIIYDAMAGFEKAAKTEYKDLLGEVSTNQTGSTAGRSYMQYAN
ncbi:hypothetical protein ACS8E2_05640 [Psychrobacter glaciei]|uniref:hypothetical protein n=1 Tax=Psychrobacter glaciei TaxID=619771 RepID=UPI003F481EBD